MEALRRAARGTVVALATAALAVGTAAPSQAFTHGQELSPQHELNPQDEPQVTRLVDGALRMTLPEPVEAAASTASLLAAAPITIPATDVRYWTSEGAMLCDLGQVCFAVPYNGGHYIFKEKSAGTYGVENWLGTGSWIDNQTVGWSSSIHNADESRRQCLQQGVDRSVDWNPIWSFQIRSYHC